MSSKYSRLKDMTEKQLGITISDCRFGEALACADRKLDCIIDREGDADGKRLEDWYLVELIVEYVKSRILTDFFMARYEEKEKAPRLPASAPKPLSSSYCSTVDNLNQYGGIQNE